MLPLPFLSSLSPLPHPANGVPRTILTKRSVVILVLGTERATLRQLDQLENDYDDHAVFYMMNAMLSDALKKRLEKLDTTVYEVAKKIAESRNPPKKVTDLNSTVAKVFDDPEGRRWSSVQEVIEAMGGEIVVRWHNIDEESLTS